MNSERSVLVLEYVHRHPGCRTQEIAAALGIERNAVRRDLERLYVKKCVGRQLAMTHQLGNRWYPEAVS